MKVTITDKEAIAALSWEALLAYMEGSTWRRADDISDKATVYQHTDATGRLWEILVPLRRDLGDYVSRMADAVTILARIEDRSELDVYEDLRALGTGSPQVDDTTRAVHERIRRWIAEEGWMVDDLSKPGWPLNIRVTVDGGQTVDIFQHQDTFGRITVSQGWTFDPEFRSEFSKLPDKAQRSVIHNIYRDVLTSGLELIHLDAPLTEMKYATFIYFDGLTKDILMQRMLHIVRTHRLTMRTFGCGFAEAGQTMPRDNIIPFREPQAAAG